MAVESAADRAAFFDPDEFGVAATWNHGGTVVTVNGILLTGSTQMPGLGPVDKADDSASFVCATSTLPNQAGQGDTLSIGGVEYRVRVLLDRTADLSVAELERQA